LGDLCCRFPDAAALAVGIRAMMVMLSNPNHRCTKSYARGVVLVFPTLVERELPAEK
jgi:hypothetical protein